MDRTRRVANRAVHFYRNGTRLLLYVYRAVKVFFLRDKQRIRVHYLRRSIPVK